MRLTKKIFTDLYASPCDEDTEENQAEQQWKICNKLGQLEDIEDELGIGLITLFKAKTKGIYVLTEELKKPYHFRSWEVEISFNDRCIPNKYIAGVVNGREKQFDFKDYGKTWALTKEELE